MGRYGYILAIAAMLIAPVIAHALRGAPSALTPAGEDRLVIITPHGQEIRSEFREAFADWHQKHFGRPVDLQFLVPGGTTDIRRQLDTIYRAIRSAHGGQLPPPDKIDVGIDMVWGGGDYEFNSKLKPLGILQPIQLDPALMQEVFPEPALSGVPLYDQERDKSGRLLPPRWIGICLSSFGIIFNADLCRSMGVPIPQTWSDLTDPRFFGSIALADPTHSASAGTAYMVVIERGMADAEEAFIAKNPGKSIAFLKSTSAYQSALDDGWKQGMQRLLLIAANARYFTDSSTQPPNDVASGNAAAGMAIDFYGRVTEQLAGPGREAFIAPRGATAVSPDPIAILYGCHGKQLELATHFIEFLLSDQGQRLWILKPGEPGGPREFALNRAPIRRSVYQNRRGWSDDFNYFDTARAFNQRNQWMGTFSELPTIWAAAWIDDHDELVSAMRKILAVHDPRRRAKLLAEISDLPVTRTEVMREIAEQARVATDHLVDPDVWQARLRLNWATQFAAHYQHVAEEASGSGG